ncbi:hypothetical protein IRBM23SM28_13240 [Alkalibacterium sp. s-m-28]
MDVAEEEVDTLTFKSEEKGFGGVPEPFLIEVSNVRKVGEDGSAPEVYWTH